MGGGAAHAFGVTTPAYLQAKPAANGEHVAVHIPDGHDLPRLEPVLAA
jgi:hypothetical protein